MSRERVDLQGGTLLADRRGQLVLIVAATIAVALVPLSLAYLQLGYHADVDTAAADTTPVGDGQRVLERTVHNASGSVAGEYDWRERDRAVEAVNASLAPATTRLERSQLDSGIAYRIARNDSAAASWAGEHCPSGPHRRFGSCESIGGVAVQERAGETAVLAVAFDVHVLTDRGATNATLVVSAVGG